jgi:hypothetical protein
MCIANWVYMSYTAHVLRRHLPILAFISILTMYVEMAVLPSIYRIEEEFSVSAIVNYTSTIICG